MPHQDGSTSAQDTPSLIDVLHRLGRLTDRQASALSEEGSSRSPQTVAGLSHQELAEVEAFRRAWAHSRDLASFRIPAAVLGRVPPAIALRHQILPLAEIGGDLVVAVAADAPHAATAQALERVAAAAGEEVWPWPVDGEALARACHAYFDPHALRGALARALERGPQEPDRVGPLEGRVPGDSPIIDLVEDILAEALAEGASDIHIDPLESDALVRYRVDGILRDALRLPATVAPAVVTRLKLMAELNIVERRHPQDGRFSFTASACTVDVRIATTPTRHGELVVLRLLRPLKMGDGLGGLGFRPGDLARYQRLVAAPNGILLVTGPTGSGKSTTLYATLTAIDRVHRNVITIEDPIEYAIDRAMQIQVNAAIGLTFAAALRSVLRLDPNVILLGEIRDPETLEIAMHAAMTGHLVLSTLHANDAVTSFARMTELGANSRQIAGSLLGVVAQRLVRRVCAKCSVTYDVDDETREAFDLQPTQKATLVRGEGCAACGDTGYHGRVGAYEVLGMNDDLGQAIADGASIPRLRALARDTGMTTMWEDARAKALSGLTTPEEVARVVQRS